MTTIKVGTAFINSRDNGHVTVLGIEVHQSPIAEHGWYTTVELQQNGANIHLGLEQVLDMVERGSILPCE